MRVPARATLLPQLSNKIIIGGMAKPRQGTGTHTFVDGTYTGEWCGGKRYGQSIMVYTSSSRCVQHAGRCAGG